MRNDEKGGRLETKLITASIRGARRCAGFELLGLACVCASCLLARPRPPALLSKGPAPVTLQVTLQVTAR